MTMTWASLISDNVGTPTLVAIALVLSLTVYCLIKCAVKTVRSYVFWCVFLIVTYGVFQMSPATIKETVEAYVPDPDDDTYWEIAKGTIDRLKNRP